MLAGDQRAQAAPFSHCFLQNPGCRYLPTPLTFHTAPAQDTAPALPCGWLYSPLSQDPFHPEWGGGCHIFCKHTHRNTVENTSKDVDVDSETQPDTHAAPHERVIIKLLGQLCGRDSTRGFQQHRADETFMLREPCFFFLFFFVHFHYMSS